MSDASSRLLVSTWSVLPSGRLTSIRHVPLDSSVLESIMSVAERTERTFAEQECVAKSLAAEDSEDS